MTEPIPKNLQLRLGLLYGEYKYQVFSFSDARNLLGVKDTYLGKIMSELCNKGWILKTSSASDNRMKFYQINDLTKTFSQMNIEPIKAKIKERKIVESYAKLLEETKKKGA